jgi:uncharacterized protein (DUF1330 family)
MPKGYVIFTEAITDPAGMEAYGRAARSATSGSGATVLVVDGQPELLEGEWHGSQTVVMEFESTDAARAWYNSDAYQAAARLRQAAANTHAVILSGFEMPA